MSGYEEQPSQVEHTETTDATVSEDSHTATHSTLETSESYETPSAQHISTDSIQDLDLSNMTISPSRSSTPRPLPKEKTQARTQFAEYPSAYETLRREVNDTVMDATSITQVTAPETPNGRPVFVVGTMAATPQSSPFLPPKSSSIPRPSTARKNTDPLLHRVLDRNYRVQATPLTEHRRPYAAATPSTAKRGRDPMLQESTLNSSPEFAPPELNHEIFSSPERRRPIPGVSVLTPAQAEFQPNREAARTLGIWDSDDDDLDDDIAFGQSPPKTMQFHIPQNRLLQTPAKEASKRIVEDILTNAGLDYGEEELDFSQVTETEGFDANFGADATSPSVVRKAMNVEDDTF